MLNWIVLQNMNKVSETGKKKWQQHFIGGNTSAKIVRIFQILDLFITSFILYIMSFKFILTMMSYCQKLTFDPKNYSCFFN